jgi:hypothetical protein
MQMYNNSTLPGSLQYPAGMQYPYPYGYPGAHGMYYNPYSHYPQVGSGYPQGSTNYPPAAAAAAAGSTYSNPSTAHPAAAARNYSHPFTAPVTGELLLLPLRMCGAPEEGAAPLLLARPTCTHSLPRQA